MQDTYNYPSLWSLRWSPGACWAAFQAVFPSCFPCLAGGFSLTEKGKNQPDILCAAPHASEDEKRVKMHAGDIIISTACSSPHIWDWPCALCIALYCILHPFVLSSFIFSFSLFFSAFGRSEWLVCDAALCSWFS